MSASDQLARIAPYLGRALEDEYIQQQIREGLVNLRRSAKRAKQKSANEALKDQRLRRQLRDAVGSLAEAVRALQQPKRPKRHLLRGGLILAVAAGGAVFAWQRFGPKSNGGSNG
jgi:hypothetical protein